MDDSPGPFLGFLRELKRRNVYRVAVTYAVVAFVTLQAAQLVFPATTLEGLYDKLVVLALVGFPLALVVAWAFEMTPAGVRRTSEAEPAEKEGTPAARPQSRSAMKALIGLGIVAAAVAGGWYLMGGGGGTEPRAGDRSIAVLPFEALGQAEPDVFTEGMHDDLLARLSSISGLDVISRTAVQRYRGTEKTTGEIAEELGVKWVVEGGVQEMGEEIQVNAQLIDPRTETHAWAESYRRDLTARSLFDLQSEITKKIAQSLEAELTPAERERVGRQPTENLEAYRLYVQGRASLDSRSERGMRRALDYFRRAIAEDSTYALAWSGLADTRMLLSVYGYSSRDTLLPRALDAARRATALDPDLAEAHASLGVVHETLRRDGPTALREFRRAVELKPSYAQAHYWLGLALAKLGRLEPAGPRLKRAVELNPTRPVYRVGLTSWYRDADSLEKALEHARTLQALGGHPAAPSKPGQILSIMGRHEEALAALQAAVDRSEPGTLAHRWSRLRLIEVLARAGDSVRARTLLAEFEGKGEEPSSLARIHATLGDRDSTFVYLAESLPGNAAQLRYGQAFEPYRDDLRYRELIRRINRQWGLNPDGSLPDSVDVSFEAQPDD